MGKRLQDLSITHAGVKKVNDKKLEAERNGQTAVKYMRFIGTACLEKLVIPVHLHGRATPSVPVHPAHISIFVMDKASFEWKTVKDLDLPCDPEIAGEGLTQEAGIKQMEDHFMKIYDDPPYIVELDNLITDHLMIECDREHAVWPNHGEMNGGEYNVPFGIFNKVYACGEMIQKYIPQKHQELLKITDIEFIGKAGLNIFRESSFIYYESDLLKMGFSLKRPMMSFLGWDSMGRGKNQKNRLLFDKTQMSRTMDCYGQKMFSGPVISTLSKDCGCTQWTGEVEVKDDIVAYKNLICDIPGVSLNLTFHIYRDGFSIEIDEMCVEDIPVLEYEAWRFGFDESEAMTGVASLPLSSEGRNGAVPFPVLIAGDDCGCLCGILPDDDRDLFMQVDSNREKSSMLCGISTLEQGSVVKCLYISKGRKHYKVEFRVTDLKPNGKQIKPHADKRLFKQRIDNLSDREVKNYAVNAYWQSIYSCFRPEHGGFSNNAISVNCHVNQHSPMEIAAFTEKHGSGLSPLSLYRYTIERAIMEGGGYGYCRDLYLDSDPILISGVGRIYQIDRDEKWLKSVEPGIVKAIDRIIGNIGNEGLAVCRSLSGDSGSYRWSSNAMDIIGFGHIDAYVNAWSYRALKNGTAIMRDLKDEKRSESCLSAAESIKGKYADILLNPETGWVAGWRSRDGILHDYAFLFINAPAIAFELLNEKQAIRALENLEEIRRKTGIGSFEFGMPHNLLPIEAKDHMLPQIINDLSPTFERYTDGALSAYSMNFYLRALSKYGFKKEAADLSKDYAKGILSGNFTAGAGVGKEFHSWEGIPIGYEGTFAGSFAPLYAIAAELGIIKLAEPEWWLE